LLPNLRVHADVESKRGKTPLSVLEEYFLDLDPVKGLLGSRLQDYLDRWIRPGFTYYDIDPYYVVPFRHKDIMSVGWNLKFRPDRTEELARLNVHDFLDVVLHGKDIPLVVDRLNMFFETDPLLMLRVKENPSISGSVVLVSQDENLAKRMVDFLRANRSKDSRLYVVHPAIFFLGRLDEISSGPNVLLDQGSINFFGRTAADSNLSEVDCAEFSRRQSRGRSFVTIISLHGLQWKPKRIPFELSLGKESYLRDVFTSGQIVRDLDLPPSHDRDGWAPGFLE